MIADALLLVGAGAIVAGVAFWSPPAAAIVAGVLLIAGVLFGIDLHDADAPEEDA